MWWRRCPRMNDLQENVTTALIGAFKSTYSDWCPKVATFSRSSNVSSYSAFKRMITSYTVISVLWVALEVVITNVCTWRRVSLIMRNQLLLRLVMKTHKVWVQCREGATLNRCGQHYLKCTMASYSCNITVSKQLQKVSSIQIAEVWAGFPWSMFHLISIL